MQNSVEVTVDIFAPTTVESMDDNFSPQEEVVENDSIPTTVEFIDNDYKKIQALTIISHTLYKSAHEIKVSALWDSFSRMNRLREAMEEKKDHFYDQVDVLDIDFLYREVMRGRTSDNNRRIVEAEYEQAKLLVAPYENAYNTAFYAFEAAENAYNDCYDDVRSCFRTAEAILRSFEE